MTEFVAEAKNITNRFGTKSVHENLDLQLAQGEVLGLIGGSGSGKSVLLRTLLGLRKPDEGTVTLLGQDPYALNEAKRRELYKSIGVLFQDGALFSGLSVFDNIAFPLREHRMAKGPEMKARVRELITQVGLEPDVENKRPSELSGGMTRRVALARALVTEPKILFLDEPTGPLDPVAANDFDDLILRLRETLGLTVLIITHDLNTLTKICTRIAMIVDKKVVAGTLADMRAQDHQAIRAFFHGERMNQLKAA